jgi:(2Fe-2S) ferredoxin
LYNTSTQAFALKALNVTTEPYTWGRSNAGIGPGIDYVWDTSTYPPGTYTVSAESKLNNMKSNYLNGSAPYYGRTVSQPTTITLVGGNPSTSTATKIGIYKEGTWYLDMNGNGAWDGTTTDRLVTAFGLPGWTPVIGDWTGDGRTKIGIYKDGTWYLDMNGNGAWDGTTTDRLVTAFGLPGWTPIVGDWNPAVPGTKIGIYKEGTWYLDMNGNGAWDGTTTDRLVTAFGLPGWTPVIGNWN